MPTLKPRVQVTMEPATHEVIDALARLQGRTRGAIISDLLDSIAPSLARTVALLEAAMEAPKEIKRGLKSVVEGIHQELVLATGEASKVSDQLDLLMSNVESLEDSAQLADPHVVTRGSGIGSGRGSGADSAPLKKSRKRSKPGGSAHG